MFGTLILKCTSVPTKGHRKVQPQCKDRAHNEVFKSIKPADVSVAVVEVREAKPRSRDQPSAFSAVTHPETQPPYVHCSMLNEETSHCYKDAFTAT